VSKPSISKPRSHRRPLLGLRARVTLTFALGALLLSAVLSIITFGLTRENLLNQREERAINQTMQNAVVVQAQLGQPGSETTINPTRPCAAIETLLDSLPKPEGAIPLLVYGGAPCGTNATKFGPDAIPASLRETVASGQAGRILAENTGEPMLMVGVPIGSLDAEYYEGESLSELEDTLEGLGISLLGASALTTVAGGLLGFWASRRVFRPLLDVGRAADAISGGRLDTRLPTGSDPDLDRLSVPFNEMAQALQERLERDARFASEVSHELRSPLMTLAASVEVIENCRDEIPERAQTALDLLSADVDRFQQLVEDLLEISRFDAGAIKLHLEEVLVAEMVIQAVSVVGGRGVPVMYDEDVNDVIVRVDKRRFARVLANLIDNAEKYAGGATAVTITREDARVQVCVEDAGPGVPEEEREIIFDRFSRGSESGKRSTDSGVGLGLALVDEHVRLHGGQVWVGPRHDGREGARFVVELPVVDLAAPEKSEAETTEAVGAGT
jgi:two-component system, OmpR family, sensor histidine kinase MtrB